MYPNLRAEMARYGVKSRDLAKALKVSQKSVNNKMSCATDFRLDEAVSIRNIFFPELKLDYLFMKTVRVLSAV
jgi:hypothetical protein